MNDQQSAGQVDVEDVQFVHARSAVVAVFKETASGTRKDPGPLSTVNLAARGRGLESEHLLKLLMRLLPLSVLAVLFLSACGGVPAPLSTSDKSASTIRAAASVIAVDGKTLSLNVSAWTSNSGGINPNPFIVTVNVESSDGRVPDGIVPAKLYIVDGQQVWETEFTNEALPFERVARTSNRFPDGTTLNFAVDLVTPQGTQLLRVAGDQVISSPQ